MLELLKIDKVTQCNAIIRLLCDSMLANPSRQLNSRPTIYNIWMDSNSIIPSCYIFTWLMCFNCVNQLKMV